VVGFQHALGDIDVDLLDSNGSTVRTSYGIDNEESLNLQGLPSGNYTLRVFGYQRALNPSYTLRFDMPNDDSYEDNDSLSTARNLGTVNNSIDISSLAMMDGHDWYRIRMPNTPGSDSTVEIRFQHQQGDLDLELYDSTGQLVRWSNGIVDNESVGLNGLQAGDYYVHVFGYSGAANPNYSLHVAGSQSGSAGHNLWVNFDGIEITAAQLQSWSTDWSLGRQHLDESGDGIRVRPFLEHDSLWGQRENVISNILNYLQQDLSPYGISVRRWTGTAVANEGETTIFVGTRDEGHPHIAGDVDFGNNNRTDIAFVGNENWGNAADTAMALSDVILHEAGHTYGLFHVNTLVGGTLYAESMGLRYSSSQDNWLQNSSFLDRTFVEYADHGGGRGSQNTHQTMLRNFGLLTSPDPSYVVQFASRPNGEYEVVLSASMDIVQAQRLPNGHLELSVNGEYWEFGADIQRLRIQTGGDSTDRLQISDDPAIEVVAGGSATTAALATKMPAWEEAVWSGSMWLLQGHTDGDDGPHIGDHDHGLPVAVSPNAAQLIGSALVDTIDRSSDNATVLTYDVTAPASDGNVSRDYHRLAGTSHNLGSPGSTMTENFIDECFSQATRAHAPASSWQSDAELIESLGSHLASQLV
jgi:hypothetical protein